MCFYDILNFAHEVYDERKGDPLGFHNLLVVHQLHLLQLLEGLVFAVIEPELEGLPGTALQLLLLVDLYVSEGVLQLLLPLLFLGKNHQHDL
jgi:hypothetical protein